jgi:hypothetical protein
VLRHGPIEENDYISEIARTECYDGNSRWDAYWRRADEKLADAGKRGELARLIGDALESERQAIAEIEKTLASW